MKNLTTRKIILGLLMVLVLGFGVQGIADAITVSGLTSGTTVTPVEIDSRTNAFTVAPSEGTVRESVTISGIQVVAIGNGNRVRTTSLRLTEKNTDGTSQPATDPTGSNGNFFSGSTNLGDTVTIRGEFTGLGKKTITVTDTTPARTATPTYTKTAQVKHTYYVVKSDSQIRSTDTFSLSKGGRSLKSPGYITEVNGQEDFYIHSGDNDFPVSYGVVGGGTLYYEDADGARTDLTATTLISGRIKVWLDANASGSTNLENFSDGTTNVVTVNIGNTANSPKSTFKAAYIFGTPTLAITIAADTTVDPSPVLTQEDTTTNKPAKFTGGTAGKNAGTIQATVSDGKGTPVGIPDVVVKFDVDRNARSGYLNAGLSGNLALAGTIVDDKNRVPTPALPTLAKAFHVRTTSEGQATLTYEMGTAPGKQRITVTAVGLKSKEVTAELTSSSVLSKKLVAESPNRRQEDSKKFELTVAVTEDEDPVENAVVIFRTNNGELERISSPPNTGAIDNVKGVVNVITNALGEARVVYDIGANTGRQEIHASIDDGTNDFQEVTLVINGGAASGGGGGGSAAQQEARLRIDTSGTGTTREVTVEALTAEGTLVPGRLVTLSGTALTASQTLTTGTAETITVPSTPGIYRLTATDLGGVYDSVTVVITVAAPAARGTLSLQAIGDPAANLQQTVEVTATNAAGTSVGGVSVTLRGTGFITETVTTGSTGSIRELVTIPSATGSHTLTAEATGYNPASIDLSATGQQTGGSSQPETRGPAGVADSIEIDGDRRLSGAVNQALRLRTRVVDANDTGVSGVRVTFKILRPGGEGRLSQRGNGLATQDETDRSGYASATVTPLGTGDLIVEAKAAKITAPVTFIINVNEASDTGTEIGTDPGAGEPTETPSREIRPEVLLGAAQRPSMLWVDSGGIYALVGTGVGRLLNVDSVRGVAVNGNKLYWTAQTGENAGTINSANLDGTGAKQLVSIKAVPRGIAVDSVAQRLYWTNSHGWIQSSDFQGRARRNVARDLSDPMDLTLSGKTLFWTEDSAHQPFDTMVEALLNGYEGYGIGSATSLSIAGGKLYWTEMTGENAGTINSVNLDGTGAKQLVSIKAVPRGIAVDSVAQRLYWTNSHGWIQSSDFQGRARRNVAKGLGSPGGIVVSANITAPATTSPTTSTTPTTADRSKYDVNGDGSVDNVDAGLVIGSLGTTTAKYDVDGDGSVTFTDVQLVLNNRDDGAAGAPMLFGMKLTADQIDNIQEQIDLFVATGDRSPDALKTLIYLQQLIATARPDRTQLLANYPNPFNPETWIPYELATDTDVRITIYNAQGVVIRTLQLGQQSAGYYTDRERAAYWDGRNAFGEQVASGVYFYQLETDTLSALRKMVILK